MILSEFAGAAQSLNGSIIVNPWDSQQVANAIHEAVTMDPDQRKKNHEKLFKVSNNIDLILTMLMALAKYISKYSAAFWGTSFVRELSRIDATTRHIDTSIQGERERRRAGRKEKGD